MQKKFNLLISCPRFHERDAMAEVRYLYLNIGDEGVKTQLTPFPGLITADTTLDPISSIHKLKEIISEDPTFLKFVLKIVPIEKVVETELENLIEIVKEFEKCISLNETFRITLKKRRSNLDTENLIFKIAAYIDRKVNLTTPNKIVMIQILGAITGLSLLTPEDLLSHAEFSL